jgi:hypothetical protein
MSTPPGPYDQHHAQQGQYHLPPQPAGYAVPPIIINNSASSSASAAAGWGVRGKRRQSFWAHFWLLLLTAGIGNAVYAWYISRWNAQRNLY